MRNRRPDLNGLLIVNKPVGWTSADVCRYVRKGTGGAKVGHAGTLDPLASGVLVLCLGRATKEISRLMDGQKRYRAEIDLAHTSTTDDMEGERTPVTMALPPTAEQVRAACDRFQGFTMQTPPAHSAVWIDGERAYKIARRGEDPAVKPRPVEIESVEVIEYAWPRLVVDVRCGKGTYIRSLARDLGRELRAGGMLTALVRTEVGGFTIERGRTPDQLPSPLAEADLLAIDPAPHAPGS